MSSNEEKGIYSRDCVDRCKLSRAVLEALDHTLNANCPGPSLVLAGQVRGVIESTDSTITEAFREAGFDASACRNPRVMRLARTLVENAEQET